MGYRVNVERGFAELAEGRRTATLLQLMNALDRGLEGMLSGERAETLKIVPNFSPAETPLSPRTPPPPPVEKKVEVEVRAPASPPVSAERRAAAKARRDMETRQLEARLKLSDVFSKSPDGVEYIVPLESWRKDLLPVPLLPVRSVRLIVSMGYDIQPARIELVGAPEEIRTRVQERFAEFVEGNRSVNLTAAVNVLAARLHIWAAERQEKVTAKKLEKEVAEIATKEVEAEVEEKPPAAPEDPLTKTHIKVIPGPPEWTFPDADDGDGDEDSDDHSDLEGSPDEEEVTKDHITATTDNVPHAAQEHGTSMSCPGIQMSGVELLEVLTLNVNIKCTKCKQERETLNLRGTPPGTVGMPQAFRCERCSQIMGIGMPPSASPGSPCSQHRFPEGFHPSEFAPPWFLRSGWLHCDRDSPQLLHPTMYLLDAAASARNEGYRAWPECFRQLSGMPSENEFVPVVRRAYSFSY